MKELILLGSLTKMVYLCSHYTTKTDMKKLLHIIQTILLLMLPPLTSQANEGRLFTSEHLTSTIVNRIAQDQQGYIWIATANGLNRYDGYSFTAYLHEPNNPRSLSHNNVLTLFIDSEGQLWVGTVKGLNRYDSTTDDFQHFDIRPDTDDEPRITNIVESPEGHIVVGTSGFGLYELGKHETDVRQINQYSADDENDYYWGIFFDREGRFWKSDNKGVVSCFSADKKPRLLQKCRPTTGFTFMFLQEADGNVLAISTQGGLVFNSKTLTYTEIHTNLATLNNATVGQDGRLLLGTTGYGLWRFDLTDLEREQVNVSTRSIDFTTASITALYEDRQHNLWVGCDQRGLLFCPNQQQAFQNWSFANQGVTSARVVRSLAPASDGGLWAAQGDGDLYHFDPSGHITSTIVCPTRLQFIYRDREGHYWMGADRTLYRFDEPSGRLQSYKSYRGDFLNTMTDDGQGTLYLSTFSAGMTVIDTHTGKERHYDMYQREAPRGYLCNNWIFAFLLDSKGMLWIATSSGVSCYNPRKDAFDTYGWHNILEGYACQTLAETATGDLLIGTDRGLFCFDRRKNIVAPFPNEAESLGSKSVNAISLEPNGDLWCATSMGIWHYSFERKRSRMKNEEWGVMTEYQSGNGLREREYTRGVSLQLADGRIVFSTSEGPVVFDPSHVSQVQHQLGDLTLTSMLVGGQPVNTQSLSDGRTITSKPIDRSNAFTLSYLDNTFTLEFSTFDFANAPNVALEYKLNNDQWSQTAAGDNAIAFNHLRPGSYRLQVRATENGQHSPIHTYTITIRAPWYRSTVAYLLYALAALLLLSYVVWRYYKGKQQQLAEEKMQFLINATHDIRTPLTLILSPLHKAIRLNEELRMKNEELKMKNEDSALSTIHASLQTIDHNAHRILDLVNQILDIRKIDKQKMQLQLQATPIVPFIQNIYKVFEAHARERNIDFRFEHTDDITAWIDPVQFDKVIQNLLSNAFKFTSDGGQITIRLETLNLKPETIRISVTDTGCGLHEADIPKLFNRFYQPASNQAAGREGTGIGLNLCKMIVEMHGGTIAAHNRTDGIAGSEFVVTIPKGMKNEECRMKNEEWGMKNEEEGNMKDEEDAGKASVAHTSYRPRILLVDDDAEITDYISRELEAHFRFATAANGKEALQLLLAGDKKYDLVVSDIMMPVMDGFTLLRAIKSNINIAHLPVILLTSEAVVGNRLEGLEKGADAFMAKPFLTDELRMQIDNLLKKAQRLKAQYGGELERQKEEVHLPNVADNDKALMDRIMQSVNKNLDNSEFSIEQMAKEVGLSRAQLHRRMKELTGLSASDFVRNIRMEQAARLLRERRVNVSQVAYSVGFSSLGTFSKVFKKHFGQPPSEYAAQH